MVSRGPEAGKSWQRPGDGGKGCGWGPVTDQLLAELWALCGPPHIPTLAVSSSLDSTFLGWSLPEARGLWGGL